METPTIREEEMEDYEDEAGSVVESQGSASPSSGGLPNRSIRPVTTVRNRLIRPVCRECKRLNLKCNLRTPCDKCMEWKRDCKYDPGALTKVDVQSVYDTKIPHQSPVSEYIQAPSSTREPDMLELTLPEWDPSRNEWIYRVSPTEIMSSRSEYRINPNQISFLEGSRFRGGVAEVVPANILDNQNFTGVVLAVKKFLFSGVGDNYSVLSLFANELQLLTDLNHENIIKLVGFVEDRSSHIAWLVFPWMANGNLKDFLASQEWEIPERISLLYDVACGVEYLHSRNPPICHGGHKSLDILVNAENRGLIADFDSARALRMAPPPSTDHAELSSPEDGSLTPGQTSIPMQHQDMEGSPQFSGLISPPTTMAIELPDFGYTLRWAAPERLTDEEPLALASDIWSFGWICWEAITNRLPFEDLRNEAMITMRILDGKVPSLSEVSNFSSIPRLRSLMEHCWQLEPKNRPSATSCMEIVSRMPRVVPTQRDATKPSPHLLRVTGDMYISASQISDGLKYITSALEIARANGDSIETALSLLSLGRAYCIKCESPEAEEAFKEVETLHTRQGQSVKGLGDVYRTRDEYSKVEELYIQARDIYSQIGDRLGFAQSIKCLGELYQMQNEHSKARESYIQARDIYSQIGNQLGFAQSVKGLGDVYHMRNEYSKAEESYLQARDIYSQIGDQLGFAQSVKSLGNVYYMRNQYNKAEESYIQAHTTYSGVDDQLGIARSVKSLGDVYYIQNQDSEAEDAYIRARDIYLRIKNNSNFAQNPSVLGKYAEGKSSPSWISIDVPNAEAICGLARLYKRRGKFSEAEALYTEAQRIHAGAGNQPGVAEATSGLADIQRITCRFDAAESTYLEVADLFGRLGDNLGIARAKCGLGDIYRQKNTHGMGEDLYREARDIVIEFGDSRELANTLYGMGHAHCLQGRSTEAASCFQEAEDIHIRIGNRVGVAEVYCGKGDLYRVQGEQDNAEATYRKARELYDEVNHHLGAADAMCGLAHIRRIQGRDREAETLFNQAEGIYKEREYGMGVANAALGVAAVYIERLEYEKAFSTITEALEFYTQAAILPLKASALMMLALTHELQEQSNKSELRIKEALAIYSAVGDESGVLACQELLHGFRDSSGTAAD